MDRFGDGGYKYQIKSEIGSGNFGSVVEAENRETGQRCAIKIIKKSSLAGDEHMQKLNQNELAIITETDHVNIVKVIELVEDPFNYYIVMELVANGNLHT